MSQLEKLQPVLIVLSAAIGLLLARTNQITNLAEGVIEPLLMILLYATFLPIPLQQFGRAFRIRSVTFASLILNFVWTPLFAWGLGALFLFNDPDLRLGLLMLLVTPCTDWYLVFTGIAKGDVALASALLPLNAILQIILLPLYVWILGGSFVTLAPKPLIISMTFVFLVPLALAILTRYSIKSFGNSSLWQAVLPHIERGQLLALNIAIITIFTAHGKVLLQQPAILLKLLPPLLLFFSLNWGISQWLGRRFKLSYPQLACLSCTTLARNSPVALAIAASAFPNRPLIALALVIGPLIELPVLAVVSQALLRQQRYQT